MKTIHALFIVALFTAHGQDIPEIELNGKPLAYRESGDWFAGVKADRGDVVLVKSAWKIEKIELEYEFSEKGLAKCDLANESVTYSDDGQNAQFRLYAYCEALQPFKRKRARKVWVTIYHDGGQRFVGKVLYEVGG